MFESLSVLWAGSTFSWCTSFAELPVWIGAVPQPTTVAHINQSQVEFTCQFRGSPPPKVTWYINGKTLEEPRYHGYYRVDNTKVGSDGFSWRVTSTLKLEGEWTLPHGGGWSGVEFHANILFLFNSIYVGCKFSFPEKHIF